MDPMEEIVKRVLLASVAVISLFAVTDSALAQAMNQGGTKEAPPSAAQKSEPSAPASKPSVTQSTSPAPKSGAAMEEKAGPNVKPQQAQEKAAPKAQPEKAASEVKPESKPSAATTNPAPATTAKDAKAPAADTKASTTGAAASSSTGAAAAPPAEKRTQIVSAIKQEKVQAVTNVNFNISIGVAVPSTVRFYPLPSRIVEIYPEWSGYDFILVNGRYIILRPRTHEIVYIIEG